MTTEERQSMKNFEAKVRQAIAQFRVLKQENADLYAELENRDEEIRKLKASLAQSQNDYNNLKLAKMIEVSDADIKESKMKISRLVREINKCINILSTSSEEEQGSDIEG
jgi:multidrug resistance efflux pump